MAITRRKILTGAAGLCATAAIDAMSGGLISQTHKATNSSQRIKVKAAPTPTPCPGATPFSIILHGLFLVELWDSNTPNEQRVRVISPKCPGMKIPHEHVAGSWKNQKFTGISGFSAPGWATEREEMPDITGLPTLAGWAGRVLNSRIHHSLYLPWPDLIIPLRNVDPTTVSHSGLGTPSHFPLTLALTYQCGAPKDIVPINQTDWSKDFNYHIFCEPKCGVGCDQLPSHADDTLRCISESFGPNGPQFTLKPKKWDCKPVPKDKPPSASHIISDEENALSEIECPPPAGQVGILSVHLPMCASLILTQ